MMGRRHLPVLGRSGGSRLGRLGSTGLAAAACVSLLLTACAQNTSGGKIDREKLEGHPAGHVAENALKGTKMTFTSYGGGFQDGQEKTLVEPFEKASGADVATDEPTDIAKIQAQVESENVLWDVVDSGADDVAANCGKLFEPLDYSVIDASKLPEQTPKHRCYVPTLNYAYGFFYNADKYKNNPPDGWEDFFDTKNYPGKRAIDGRTAPTSGTLEAGLLGDGVAPDELYPLDIDRALGSYDKIKNDLAYWETGAQQTQMAESGEADMVFGWSGRIFEANQNGANFKPVWNQSLALYDVLAVPKGAPNKDAAMAFINYTLGAKQQAAMSEETSYSPVHTEAEPDLSKEAAEFNTTRPEVLDEQVTLDISYWGKHQEEITDAWTKWLNQ
ncbi:MAG: polyamine ABC transporter substrate-binding protein [Micromonosporaceae bacterium]